MLLSKRPSSLDLIAEELLGKGAANILARAQNPIFICTDQAILYVNAQAFKTFGFENESNVISRPIADFVDEEFADIIMLGLDAFADEAEGIPLKMMEMTGTMLDVKMVVNRLPTDELDIFMIECQDITEFLEASQSARMREDRIRSILQSVNEGIVTIDELGIIQDFNNGAETMFGYSKQNAIGNNVSLLMPEPYKSDHHGYMVQYLLSGKSTIFNTTRELSGQKKSGEVFPLELSVTRVVERKGRQVFTGIMRDISERKKQEERLAYIAYHDVLTGLPNRAMFEEHLTSAKSRSSRTDMPMGLIFIDLDNFKPINDTLGHEAGDLVLIEVAKRFKQVVRGSDTVARLGGDEFVAIIENLTDLSDMEVVAKKMLDALSHPISLQGDNYTVGASLGIAVCPLDADDLEQLIDRADKAMYEAKKSGRNQYKLYRDLA